MYPEQFDDRPSGSSSLLFRIAATLVAGLVLGAIVFAHGTPTDDTIDLAAMDGRSVTVRRADYERALYNSLNPPPRPPKLAHGGSEPPWNDPTVPGGCTDGSGEHDTWCGAEWVLSWYEESPNVYCFVNAIGQPQSAVDDCGFTGPYANAGQLGLSCLITLRVIGGNLEASPNAQGFVLWSAGWQPAFYTPFGWTMIDLDQVYSVWWTGAGSGWFTISDASGWIGWQRVYVNPTDPSLVGVSVYHWGIIDYDSTDDPTPPNIEEMAGLDGGDVWRITFTDQ